MKLTNQWQTVATIPFCSTVSPGDEDRRAHGNICHLQARERAGGRLEGRRVNVNGRFKEVGRPFAMTADDLERWNSMASM